MTGSLSVDSQFAVGTGINTDRQVYFAGSYTGAAESKAFGIDTTLNPVGINSSHGMEINPAFNRAAVGIHPVFSNIWLRAPTISGGTGTVRSFRFNLLC